MAQFNYIVFVCIIVLVSIVVYRISRIDEAEHLPFVSVTRVQLRTIFWSETAAVRHWFRGRVHPKNIKTAARKMINIRAVT